MKRQLTLTALPINETELLAQRRVPDSVGAVVYFLGVVRGQEECRRISALKYEAFQRMAEHQFELIFRHIEKRWKVESVRLVHRVGPVKVNEPSFWVEVTAAHREE